MAPMTLTRQASSVLLLRWVTLAIGFATWVFISRVVGPEGRGALTFINSVVGILTIFLGFGLSESATYLFKRKELTAGEAVGSVLLFWLLASAFIFGLFAWQFDPIVHRMPNADVVGSEIRHVWMWIGLSTLPLLLLTRLIQTLWTASDRIRLSGVMTIGGQLVSTLCIVLSVIILNLGVTGVLVSNLIAQLASVGVILYWLRTLGPDGILRFRPKILARLMRFSTGPYLNSLTSNAFKQGEGILLAFLLDLKSLGHYGVGMALYDMLNDLPRSVVWPLMGQLSGMSATGQAQVVAKKGRLQLAAMIVPIFGMALLGPLLVPKIYGEAFSHAGTFLGLMAVGSWFRTLHLTVYSYFAATGRTGAVLPSAIVAMTVNFGLDVLLAPSLGLIGIALSNVAAEILASIVSLLIFLRETRVSVLEVLPPRPSDFREVWSLTFRLIRVRH